jgi:hypothetical protein
MQFGPCSKKKIKLEMTRLENLLQSVKLHGFIDGGTTPDGYVLENSHGERVFHVMDGNHRIAVQAHMAQNSEQEVSVYIRKGFPAIIKEADVKKWPAVISGVLTEDEALRIFKSFFRNGDVSIFELVDSVGVKE